MLFIPLKNSSLSAMVDDEDFERLSRWQWLIWTPKNASSPYAVRYENQSVISMHRVVLDAVSGDEVDHRNGDGLNNCKENLRTCTHAQNMCNRKKHRNGRSQFKGIYYDKRTGKWRAKVQFNKKKFAFGYHQTEEAAARAYDEGAKKLHGEFARLNFG